MEGSATAVGDKPNGCLSTQNPVSNAKGRSGAKWRIHPMVKANSAENTDEAGFRGVSWGDFPIGRGARSGA